MRSIAIPGESTCDVRRTYRPVVAKRELHGERVVDGVDIPHAKVDQRRRAQVDDDEISVTTGLDRTNAVAEIQRLRSAARREPPRAGRRQRMTAELRHFARSLHRAQ